MKNVIDLNKRYTLTDYFSWADDRVRGLIDGAVKLMSPSANFRHQKISFNVNSEIQKVIEGNECNYEVCQDLDVIFSDNTVVRPDVLVVCDVSKLAKGRCYGVPDLVVEIQSHSTAQYDLTEKFQTYEKFGVPEYWIVYPYEHVIHVFKLQTEGKYAEPVIYEKGAIPLFFISDSCSISLDIIFKSRNLMNDSII
jgi:Uma2 family endonuclease